MAEFFKEKFDFKKFFIQITPIISSLISMLLNTNDKYLYINLCFLILTTFGSILNHFGCRISNFIPERKEIIHICLFIIISIQNIINLSCSQEKNMIKDFFLQHFDQTILINALPLILSFLSDIFITVFFDRKHAIVFKIIASIILLIINSLLSNHLLYDFRIASLLLIVPSFLTILCLPKTYERSKRDKKRIKCLISQFMFIVTCTAVILYMIRQNKKVYTIETAYTFYQKCVHFFSNPVTSTQNMVSNVAANLKSNFVDKPYNFCMWLSEKIKPLIPEMNRYRTIM